MESEELKLILKQQTEIMATMQSQMKMLQQQMTNKPGSNESDTKSRVNVPWPQPLEVNSGEPNENLSFFKNGWTNYCLATGMNKWGEDKMELKAGLLISAIGSAAMKKYMEFGLTDEEKRSEGSILRKMDETIKKKTNIIYCRYIFNARNQLLEERFEDYLLTLRKLIKPCDYGDIEDEILRDRIVVGIKDNEVKKELLREADLKLELTISICRSAETAAEQLTTLQSSECEVNEISKVKKYNKEAQLCKFCGQKHIFGRDRCPAYGKRCEACKGRNHFKLVCKKFRHPRTIKEVREEYSSSEEETIIKAIRANERSGHTEAELLFKIRGRWVPLFCTLDTGAQVCVMSIKDYKKLTGSEDVSNLTMPSHKLKCYNGSELVEFGVAQFECLRNNKLYKIEFHIVEASHEPLLSENACLSLGLIKYCNSVNSGNIKDRAKAVELFKEYSDIFEGYGKLPGEVSLEIDASVPPRIQSARRVPMAVREKLKEELEQLEKDGIIVQEMQHTDWMASAALRTLLITGDIPAEVIQSAQWA
ncbi:uncharacterized protein [Choristoneura fumiferana]|uniref:uncharacterized protein n=1 Tax=Choristoneura fumiferana TaxID=7141 RepID=UPI003D156C1E